MKKFLIYLVVILVAVSIGFTVFYLVRDNEVISITTSNIYMREGDVIDDLEILYENKKSFSDYEVFSSNDSIAKYDKDRGTLTAVGGGIATITFRTSNEKFRNLSCQVYVGDGSITSPYYIQTAQELQQIGALIYSGGENGVVKYGLDKCYKLVNNLSLTEGHSQTGYWIPIGTGNEAGFTGNFDGNGYTISNVNVNKQKYVEQVDNLGDGFKTEVENYRDFINAGLFSKIGINGRVANLKLENININGEYLNGNVGVVAGENRGTIERIEVKSGYVNVTGSTTVGGVVGYNACSETGVANKTKSDDNYSRNTARVDRSSANVELGIPANYDTANPITGASKYVGGLVGHNNGGIVIYSYSKGEVHLNDNTLAYGGIVGLNSACDYAEDYDYMYTYTGAHIKDCYSVMKLNKINAIPAGANIGAIVGSNEDKYATKSGEGFINRIVGNYYLPSAVNYISEGQNPTDYIGCGSHTIEGVAASNVDEPFVIEGKTADALKIQDTYVSHIKEEYVMNSSDTLSTTVTWKFDTIWTMDPNVNSGYPTLNYTNLEISDDILLLTDGESIDSVEELQAMKLDGNYVLAADIVFDAEDVWVPIGTLKNPFVGSLKAGAYYNSENELSYYKIYNLKTSASTDLADIERNTYEFAGLFGVTSGNSGYVENITLVNPTIANGAVVGGIVASNGYTTNNVNAAVIQGFRIEDCSIVGGKLRGKQKVGGIVGDNYGTITYSSIKDNMDSDYNIINKTQILLYGDSQGYAGGIAGYNNADCLIKVAEVTGNTSITATSGNAVSFNVYVGGIAGVNEGEINTVIVDCAGGVSISGLSGCVGGVAGVNHSKLQTVAVSTSVSAPTSNSQVYAGGVAGKLIKETSVASALVSKATVTGYNAGGIAAYINYSVPNDGTYGLQVDKNGSYTLGSQAVTTIQNVAIHNNVSIEGEFAGGFAATVDNAIIKNCYTRAALRGVNSSSIKSGFATYLNLSSSGHVGLFINCYSVCSFDSTNGANYAVSVKEVFQNTMYTGSQDAMKRQAGYIFNCVYLTQDGVTEPQYDEIIVGWIKTIGRALNIDDGKIRDVKTLYGRSEIYNTYGFNDKLWKFNNNALPTLISSEGVANSVKNAFSRTYVVTIPNNVTVTRNNVPLADGDIVNKGDILVISYEESPKFSMTKFTVNGNTFENGGVYNVGSQKVEIEYEEVQTSFDVEITQNPNAFISAGQDYFKPGEIVTIAVVPNDGYELVSITVKKADGTIITLNPDNTFTMINEKVIVEAVVQVKP